MPHELLSSARFACVCIGKPYTSTRMRALFLLRFTYCFNVIFFASLALVNISVVFVAIVIVMYDFAEILSSHSHIISSFKRFVVAQKVYACLPTHTSIYIYIYIYIYMLVNVYRYVHSFSLPPIKLKSCLAFVEFAWNWIKEFCGWS